MAEERDYNLIASVLAELQENERKMDEGIEEAVKAYRELIRKEILYDTICRESGYHDDAYLEKIKGELDRALAKCNNCRVQLGIPSTTF